jgi:hypothetical protein
MSRVSKNPRKAKPRIQNTQPAASEVRLINEDFAEKYYYTRMVVPVALMVLMADQRPLDYDHIDNMTTWIWDPKPTKFSPIVIASHRHALLDEAAAQHGDRAWAPTYEQIVQLYKDGIRMHIHDGAHRYTAFRLLSRKLYLEAYGRMPVTDLALARWKDSPFVCRVLVPGKCAP